MIDDVGGMLADKPEIDRPNKVIIVTMTDGEENASTRFNINDVERRVKLQTNRYGWKFVFMGANIDSFAVAETLGISKNLTSNYSSTTRAIRGLSESVLSYRKGSNFKI